jgi:uncharacterized protein (DUF885 family)
MPKSPRLSVSDRFQSLVAEYVREQSAAHPGSASFLGDREWDHESTDMSAAAIRHREARDRHWLRTFERVDPDGLTADQRVDRELILAQVGAAVDTASFQAWKRAPEQYVNDGVFELFVHQARPEGEAVAAAVDRLARVPALVAAAKRNISADLASPDILRRDLATVRGQAYFLREELASFVNDPELQQRLRAAAEPAAAAYDELGDHVERLAGRAKGSFVFGEQRYNSVLQKGEMLSFDARSLRDMGRREYADLDSQMQEVAQRISGSRDWKTLLPQLQKQHATDMPGLLQEYRDLTERARRFVVDHALMSLPDGERCAVEPAPAFMRGSTAVASYFPAAPFLPGTRGTFNVPYTPDGSSAAAVEDRLRSNAHYENAATTAHEAYPGHHAHFVHMANASPLRQFISSTYFIEGWAHYVEKMMFEQGFYKDDEEVLGYLAARIFRASRIIVDTSLHLGEMSVDDAATFMHEKAGLPPEVARAEALRYAAWPTQASAYLTGALAIEAMAKRWVAEGHGTLKQFHDAVTDQGALPPGLAARAIGLDAAQTNGLSL